MCHYYNNNMSERSTLNSVFNLLIEARYSDNTAPMT